MINGQPLIFTSKIKDPEKIAEGFYLAEFHDHPMVIRESLLFKIDQEETVSIRVCQCHIPWMFTYSEYGSINAFYAIQLDSPSARENPFPNLGEGEVLTPAQIADHADYLESTAAIMCSPGPCMSKKVFPYSDLSKSFEEFQWNGFYYMPLVTTAGYFFYYRHEFTRDDWYNQVFQDRFSPYAGSVESTIDYNIDLRILNCREIALVKIDYKGGSGDDPINAVPKFPLEKI